MFLRFCTRRRSLSTTLSDSPSGCSSIRGSVGGETGLFMADNGNAGTAFGSLAGVLLLGALAFGKESKNWLLQYYPNATHTGPPTRAWVRRPELGAHDTLLDAVPDREDFTVRLETCLEVR